jgi:hypothetical protein
MGRMCNKASLRFFTTSSILNGSGIWNQHSVLNQPTLLTNDGECFGPKLGYDIPTSITDLVGVSPSLVQAILKGLLVILILHPINAVLSLLSLISSLFLASPGLAILALILTIITALVSSVVLAVDLTLVIVAKNKVPELTNNGFVVEWGNAVWMVLVAVIFTWLATILLSARVCYCCGVRRSVVCSIFAVSPMICQEKFLTFCRLFYRTERESEMY